MQLLESKLGFERCRRRRQTSAARRNVLLMWENQRGLGATTTVFYAHNMVGIVEFMGDKPSVSGTGDDSTEYKAAGQEAVHLKFVSDVDSMKTAESYHPEFVHQHFGDSESIFGYKDLKVTLYYSDQSMYIYPEIEYTGTIKEKHPDIEPDDIIIKLKDQLPNWQMDTMATSLEGFKQRLEEQKQFKLPEGQQIGSFRSTNEKLFEVFKVTQCTDTFDHFVTRTQTLALWYIDAADYTDNSDIRFSFYFVYEVVEEPGTKQKIYKVAGYALLCNYHAYLEKIRPRVAQILLLPQHRGAGNGAKFWQVISNDLITQERVIDVTAEDPADSFLYLRDFVDCSNCLKLPEFSVDNLKGGYSTEMKDAARNKLKINPRQSRRVYEILRYMNMDKKNAAEMKDYRIDVKRRLEFPMKRSGRDWKKMNSALGNDELSVVLQGSQDDNKFTMLEEMFKQTVEEYKVTIQRLQTYRL
uniref:Histone acetyltransferase type B catalytic subunit n=1 Tax=Steinernema glaseri TaxID=37863 RepID=A0A1I8A3M5_9BILA